MREFNYSSIRKRKWDSDILGCIVAIYKEAGKQELYLKLRPDELEKLVEIAKIKCFSHIYFQKDIWFPMGIFTKKL